jgi:hypothetical protein
MPTTTHWDLFERNMCCIQRRKHRHGARGNDMGTNVMGIAIAHDGPHGMREIQKATRCKVGAQALEEYLQQPWPHMQVVKATVQSMTIGTPSAHDIVERNAEGGTNRTASVHGKPVRNLKGTLFRVLPPMTLLKDKLDLQTPSTTLYTCHELHNQDESCNTSQKPYETT